MSNNYLISDLHLSHKNIMKFAGEHRSWAAGMSLEEHDYTLIERIRSVARSPRDTLYILGDVAFDPEALKLLDAIPAKKILFRGNHDVYDDDLYRAHFDRIMGIGSKKGFWMSHAPVHPIELRGKKCIHGHVHQQSIMCAAPLDKYLDSRYINVCVENCDGFPINFRAIQEGTFKGTLDKGEEF